MWNEYCRLGPVIFDVSLGSTSITVNGTYQAHIEEELAILPHIIDGPRQVSSQINDSHIKQTFSTFVCIVQ